MLNMKIIHKVIGTLLFIEAAMMAGCMGMAIYLGEDDSLAFSYLMDHAQRCGHGYWREEDEAL